MVFDGAEGATLFDIQRLRHQSEGRHRYTATDQRHRLVDGLGLSPRGFSRGQQQALAFDDADGALSSLSSLSSSSSDDDDDDSTGSWFTSSGFSGSDGDSVTSEGESSSASIHGTQQGTHWRYSTKAFGGATGNGKFNVLNLGEDVPMPPEKGPNHSKPPPGLRGRKHALGGVLPNHAYLKGNPLSLLPSSSEASESVDEPLDLHLRIRPRSPRSPLHDPFRSVCQPPGSPSQGAKRPFTDIPVSKPRRSSPTRAPPATATAGNAKKSKKGQRRLLYRFNRRRL